MASPPLRIPLSLNMAEFEKNLERSRALTSDVTQFIVKRFIDMNASVLATSGAAGSAALGFRSLLGTIVPLSAAIAGIVGVFQLMSYATDLAKERIEEFNKVADEAAGSGVSTDFFQRWSKSAEKLRTDVDDARAALERFSNTAKDELGGSDLQNEIDKLTGYGNFAGNSGAGALAGATGTEERLRATVGLINQALESGQRLAALDIAEKAFGPKIADNLRQDSNYLTQMLATADKIRAEEIISQAQVGQAIELKTRLEDAQKVLAEKFKPIQDDLAKLGVNYHESWISIVETMSGAVTKANELYDAIKRIPDVMADLGNSPFWSRLTEATGRLGLNSDPKSLGLILPGEAGFSEVPGNAALAAGLRNPSAVRQAMQRATDIQTAVRGDGSKGPPDAAAGDERDQFDRTIDSITKHIATLNADTAATFQNNAARAQFRAEFQALTAIMRDEGEVTQAQIDRYEKLRQSMTAQQALEAAGITLTKEHAAAFLAASDGIGRAAGAYDQAREKLQQINSASATLGSALSNAFTDAIFEARNLNEVLDSLLKTLAKAGINSLFSSFFNAPASGGLSPFASLFKGIIPGFAEGADSAPGGLAWVGERGPELVNLPKGAQVVPNAVASRIAGGGATVNNTFMVAGDVSQATVNRLAAAVVAANRKADQLANVFTRTQRMQTTGVG